MELGWTLTFWVHCASSDELAAPASTYEPECTGLVTTLPAEHVQPDRFPDSNPELVRRLVLAAAAASLSLAAEAEAEAGARAPPRATPAATTTATGTDTRATTRDRAMFPPGKEPPAADNHGRPATKPTRHSNK